MGAGKKRSEAEKAKIDAAKEMVQQVASDPPLSMQISKPSPTGHGGSTDNGRTCKTLMGDAKRSEFAKLFDLGVVPHDPRIEDIILRLDVILSVIGSKKQIDTEAVRGCL